MLAKHLAVVRCNANERIVAVAQLFHRLDKLSEPAVNVLNLCCVRPSRPKVVVWLGHVAAGLAWRYTWHVVEGHLKLASHHCCVHASRDALWRVRPWPVDLQEPRLVAYPVVLVPRLRKVVREGAATRVLATTFAACCALARIGAKEALRVQPERTHARAVVHAHRLARKKLGVRSCIGGDVLLPRRPPAPCGVSELFRPVRPAG
eukprot:scaffold5308_cov70-Phaeocystis_antarctica.AAC.3